MLSLWQSVLVPVPELVPLPELPVVPVVPLVLEPPVPDPLVLVPLVLEPLLVESVELLEPASALRLVPELPLLSLELEPMLEHPAPASRVSTLAVTNRFRLYMEHLIASAIQRPDTKPVPMSLNNIGYAAGKSDLGRTHAEGAFRADAGATRFPLEAIPVSLLDLAQWPAMVITVTAAYFVSSTRAARRRAGFWLYLFSNVLWVIWGVSSRAYALILLQLCLAVMNIRGERKNSSMADRGDESERVS